MNIVITSQNPKDRIAIHRDNVIAKVIKEKANIGIIGDFDFVKNNKTITINRSANVEQFIT